MTINQKSDGHTAMETHLLRVSLDNEEEAMGMGVWGTQG